MVDGHPGVRVGGPLAPYTVGFAASLTERGYARHSVSTQVNLMAHLSRWLAWRELDAADLTAPVAERFVVMMRATRRVLVAERGLAPLLEYLRERSAAPSPVVQSRGTPRAELLQVFGLYLRDERGLADSTVHRHVKHASTFLDELGDPLSEVLRELSGGRVLQAVSRMIAAPMGIPAARTVTGTIRILLGFLFVTGRIGHELAPVVPAVARSRSAPPGRMKAADVAAVLESCDRTTATGRRDYAVILLAARLGLRAGDVAALTLGDVDWRAGEIIVHGKGGRDDKLPLPHDVGAAIADYLSARRPGDSCRAVFLSARAPHRPLSLTGVGQLVQAAGARAHVAAATPRLLRQTLASDLLQAGAPLAEIAQVLRHRDIVTTARHYAAVDPHALAELVRPWPSPPSERGRAQ